MLGKPFEYFVNLRLQGGAPPLNVRDMFAPGVRARSRFGSSPAHLTDARVGGFSEHKVVTGIWSLRGAALPRGLSSSSEPGHQGHVLVHDGPWFPPSSSLTLTFILLRMDMVGGRRFLLNLGRREGKEFEISAVWQSICLHFFFDL